MVVTSLNPISQIQSVNQAQIPINQVSQTQQAGNDFAQFLNNSLNQLNGLQQSADAASNGLASGQIQDISSAMIAINKANLGFSLAVQVRDKVLNAYNEIMKMQM